MTKRNLIAAGMAALIVSACAGFAAPDAQLTTPAEADAQPIELDKERLEALEHRMKQFVLDGQLYGIHTRLVQGGEIVSETQFGLRDVIAKKPIEDDTIYRIYSMSKPITGVAMMQLYEQGKWKLDDPVTKFLPELGNLQVLAGQDETGEWQFEPLDRSPTLAELMSHTAGYGYGLSGDDPVNAAFRGKEILRSPDLKTLVNRVAETPMLFQPGERWEYSIAVDLQGAIIERISGKTLGEYFDEHIFVPLGMKDTAFYVPEQKYDRLSQVFGYDPETGQMVPVPFETVMFKKDTIAFESGGGGLVSTMDDYAVFCQAMLNGGNYNGQRLLKPETVKMMRSNRLADEMDMWSTGSLDEEVYDGLGFGLGFGVIDEPEKRGVEYGKGTFFWGGAAKTWFWIDPVNDLYFIGMVQLFESNAPEKTDFREISAKLVYNELPE